MYIMQSEYPSGIWGYSYLATACTSDKGAGYSYTVSKKISEDAIKHIRPIGTNISGEEQNFHEKVYSSGSFGDTNLAT